MDASRWHPATLRAFFSAALLVFGGLTHGAIAQSGYDFTVAHETYTTLANGSSTEIPFGQTAGGLDLEGETLPIYGENYAPNAELPLVVSGTGFIRFDKPEYSVVIDGFLVHMDVLNERSGIFYEIDFVNGENVVKVEWREAALIDTPDVADDYINFQIWVYQTSGVVELRYGPSKLEADYGALIGGGPFVGIFRFTQDPGFRVLQKNWLLGDPKEPYHDKAGQSLGMLAGFPEEGTVYRFTPTVPSSVEEEKEMTRAFRVAPSVIQEKLVVERTERTQTKEVVVQVYDVSGTVIAKEVMTGSRLEISTQDWPSGLYFCKVAGESHQVLKSGK